MFSIEKIILLLTVCAYLGVHPLPGNQPPLSHECPPNEKFDACAMHCNRTCEDPNPMCRPFCNPRCDCIDAYLRNSQGKCVPYDHCISSVVDNTDTGLTTEDYRLCGKIDEKTSNCLDNCNLLSLPRVVLKDICLKACCPSASKVRGAPFAPSKNPCY